ncbi:MAG: hypothetical protein SF029_01530 [bacterium]|nr:hypothetical protein [bacterium]
MRRFILLFTCLFLLILAFDLYPGLRGGSGWRWPYALPESAGGLLVLAAALLVYLSGVWLLKRMQRHIAASLLWAFVGAAALGFAVVGVRGDVGFLLFTRTVSPVQTGASAIAVREMSANGVQSTLERWPEVMREALDANLIHFTTSPPGQPLLHDRLARLFDPLPLSQSLSMALRPYQCAEYPVMRYTRGEIVSAGVGMLMPVWAALTVFPLYWAGWMLFERKTAAQLTLWWPLIPTVLLFAPTWNTLYPLLGILSFALLLAGLRRQGIGFALYTIAAGVVMSAATFLNFAVLPLLLLFGLFTLGYCLWAAEAQPDAFESTGEARIVSIFQWKRWSRTIIAGVCFGLGLLSIWLVFFAVSGITPLELLRVTFEKHSNLVQRDYLPWLILHPYDTLLFVGWPLALLFVGAVTRFVQIVFWGAGARHASPLQNAASDTLSAFSNPPSVLLTSTLLTFLLVNLAGIVQGENARILSFYAPFFLLCAGGIFAPRETKWDFPLLIGQALTVLVMAAVLPVVPLDLNPQPTTPRTDVPTFDFLELRPVDTAFESAAYAGEFALDDYRFIADVAQQAITLELHWRGISRTERPYRFEIVASAENAIDGEIVTEPHIWVPQSGNYLTTCWQAGDLVRDVTIVPLPTVSAPVVWTLELRAVDERTGDVLAITRADGSAGSSLTLDPVNYP